MDRSNRQSLIDWLFEATVDLDEINRKSFLDRECDELPEEIRQYVEDLLSIDADEMRSESLRPISTNLTSLLPSDDRT